MMNLKNGIVILLALSLVTLPAVSKGQDNNADRPIRVNTFLVGIPVIAGDRNGRYVSGLKKENFSIFQDNVKQDIEFFADEEAPMNVALLIDSSSSTTPVINDLKNAAWDFVKIFRPQDKGLIVTFDYGPNVLSGLTSDKNELQKAIFYKDQGFRGGSNMQGALYQIVTKEFASVKGRKAVIILTDGEVEGRFISNEKLLQTLAESDTLVYPVIFDSESYRPKPSKITKWRLPNGEIIGAEEFRKRREIAKKRYSLFMTSVADVSGGRLFNSNDFNASFQSIADELKKQYLVGFYPQNVEDGKSHQIAVEVNRQDIVIKTKRSIRLKVSD